MQTDIGQKRIFTASVLLCGASFLLVLLLGYNYWRDTYHRGQIGKDHVKLEAVRGAEQVETKLHKIVLLAQSLADDLRSETWRDEQVVDRLKNMLDKHPQLFAVGAAYVPFAHDPAVRLYAPHYVKKDGEPELVQIEALYDYTEQDWYKDALAQGSVWVDSYFEPAGSMWVVGVSVSFYRFDAANREKNAAGVVRLTFPLADLAELVSTLDLGKTGHGFILSKTGVYLSHPIDALVRKQKTIFDEARDRNDQELQVLGEKATNGESGVLDYTNTVTGQSSWIFYEPIPSTGWSLQVVFFPDEIPVSSATLRRQLLWIGVGLIAFMLFLSILVFRAYQGHARGLWRVAVSSSFLFIAGIGFTWHLALAVPDRENNVSIEVTDKAGVNEFLTDNARVARQSHQAPAVYIPTGVFVESIEFSSATGATLTGYIWQKYDAGVHDQVPRGVVLLEARDVQMTEAYRRKEKNVTVIGWHFQGVLQENADDYVKYPLDRGDIWIRLRPKGFAKNVILTPDFDSYKSMNPTALPGLEQNLVLAGWTIDRSFFGYRVNSYGTNLGIDGSAGQGNTPELYFNIIMRRDLIDPFISDLLPLAAVATIIFALLLVGIKEGEQVDSLDLSTSLLFVVILAQVGLRGKLDAERITYLGYFYSEMFFVILTVTLLVSRLKNNRFLQYQGGLTVTMLYWPVLLGLALGTTLCILH